MDIFVKGGKENKWLPLFQSVVMNEVNLTAGKMGRMRFKTTLSIADCRLSIVDWIKMKKKAITISKRQLKRYFYLYII